PAPDPFLPGPSRRGSCEARCRRTDRLAWEGHSPMMHLWCEMAPGIEKTQGQALASLRLETRPGKVLRISRLDRQNQEAGHRVGVQRLCGCNNRGGQRSARLDESGEFFCVFYFPLPPIEACH